jgi:hypothetical protein
MSDQLNVEVTRQHFLCQLDASKQMVQEFSEEELKNVVGGIGTSTKFFASGLVAAAIAPQFLSDMFAFQKKPEAAR